MLAILSGIGYKLAGVPNLVNGVPDLVDSGVKNGEEKIFKLFKSALLAPILLI